MEWSRGEDAGDLKRSELNEWVETWTCPNAFEGKNWKNDQKVVTDEDSVQNGAMDGQFVKNFVVDAKIDPKVVVDLSVFKICGSNILQPSDRNCWRNLLIRMLRG